MTLQEDIQWKDAKWQVSREGLFLRICGGKLFWYPAGNPLKEVYTNPVFGGFESFFDTFKDRIGSFVNQIYDGAKPEEIDGSGEAGLEASRVIHAAIKSLELNMPVKVKSITE